MTDVSGAGTAVTGSGGAGETKPLAVRPIIFEPAYVDPDSVWQSVLERAPYGLLAGGGGYSSSVHRVPIEAWFRSAWAYGGEGKFPEAQALLFDERFMDAARELYGAEIVRPQNLIVNVMGPMAVSSPHLDLPTYRGIERNKVPAWLPMAMGLSGLFERWAIRVAGGLTWFYDGADGEYEYWPNGTGAPSESVRGPFGNVGLVGDNDLMYHRVGPIGDVEAFKARVQLPIEAQIRSEGDHWELTDGSSPIATLGRDEVRVSLVWRAIALVDEREARALDDHEDDLDVATIVSIFSADLAAREISFSEPAEPLTDEAWAKVVIATYLPGFP